MVITSQVLNRTSLAIIALLASLSVAVAGTKSEREHQCLFGNVKQIIVSESTCSNKSGKWVEGKRAYDRTVNYDVKGNLIKEVRYDGTVRAPSETNYHYDSKGNRTDSVYLNNSKSQLFRFVRRLFKCDANHNRIEELVYSREADGPIEGEILTERYLHSYDNNGNRATTEYYHYGVFTYKSICDYDTKGTLAEQSFYSKSGKLQMKELYSYEFDTVGNWIKRVTKNQRIEHSKVYTESMKVTYQTISYY